MYTTCSSDGTRSQWPVEGPEETVMQSILSLSTAPEEEEGFIFDTGYYITIAGLTITNCGYPEL